MTEEWEATPHAASVSEHCGTELGLGNARIYLLLTALPILLACLGYFFLEASDWAGSYKAQVKHDRCTVWSWVDAEGSRFRHILKSNLR